jgi:hypothetical protein
VAKTRAGIFPQVVWTHFRWERRLHSEGVTDEGLEKEYLAKLSEFEREHGELEHVYWSTRGASAVAISVKRGPKPRADPFRLREPIDVIRFHRVTDWVTRDVPLVANLLDDCDLLASRVERVLRGASQQIATRWILGIAMHLLGFLERDTAAGDGTSAERRERTNAERRDRTNAERQFVRAQRAKLAEVEAYYHRAASQAGRIVYVSGMLVGLVLLALLGAIAAWLLGRTSISARHLSLAFLCLGCGAIGALVSTIARMGKPEAGKFNVDFELGRHMVRRLGAFRPFVGGIFGVALFFLLASGLLGLNPTHQQEPYYYGFIAFLAGFSERFATGMLGSAERRLEPGQDPPEGTAHPGETQPDESI